MASPARINVDPQFNMTNFTKQLAVLYQNRGFTVAITPFGASTAAIKFDKNTGGINMLLGLGQGVTANCTLNNNVLDINYNNEDWTGKIIGLAVGWVFCLVPFVTAIIGIVKQVQLTKDISIDAAMVASGGAGIGMNTGYTAPYAQQFSQPASVVAPQSVPAASQAQTATGNISWDCQCGARENTGPFCGQCGHPKP